MVRLVYTVCCWTALTALIWAAHAVVFGANRDFGMGFATGGTAMAIIASAYITLRYGE